MKRFIFFFMITLGLNGLNAQIDLKEKLSGYTNPDELVTLSESVPFDQAVDLISKVSEQITGKKVFSVAGFTAPIGFEIDKMQYKKALIIIAQYNNLIVEETAEALIVKRKGVSDEARDINIYAGSEEKEVKISAVLFEANVTDMTEKGINWQFLLSRNGLSIGSEFRTLQEEQEQTGNTSTQQTVAKPPTLDLTTESKFTMGKFAGNASAMFRFFETDNLGEIIARPTVSVRNGIQGRTQVGSDISIKERDFSGNLIDKFYSTGTIIEVTPYIYNQDGLEYVLLKVKVERSSAIPDVISTEIRKTAATTSVLLLNGEETVIGGLFVNEDATSRRGIPFLKDLPWWFFGLKYIFGYDQVSYTKKEIIISIKAEILPTLRERLMIKKDAFEEQKKENLEMFNKYRTKQEEENKNK
ncbi:MAG: type II and III secretion system protein [Melioribacteraceae bacterium]|nr:type II and III secretion system protein [Melioribacteraceae bacterium]